MNEIDVLAMLREVHSSDPETVTSKQTHSVAAGAANRSYAQRPATAGIRKGPREGSECRRGCTGPEPVSKSAHRSDEPARRAASVHDHTWSLQQLGEAGVTLSPVHVLLKLTCNIHPDRLRYGP